MGKEFLPVKSKLLIISGFGNLINEPAGGFEAGKAEQTCRAAGISRKQELLWMQNIVTN
ncbi:MAG TPA: hypothetical protein PK965_02915 [Anaerohalosphaeraceae bacterium]|nr:hypothetical protein [Anaerohalosphaeraceae bacterium]